MRYAELLLARRRKFQRIGLEEPPLTLKTSLTALPWTIPQPLLRLPEAAQGIARTVEATKERLGGGSVPLLDGLFGLLSAFGRILEEWVGKALDRMGQEAKYQLGRTVDRAFQNAAEAAAARLAKGESLEEALAAATKSFLGTMAQLPANVLGTAPSAFASAGADLLLAALNGAKGRVEEPEAVSWDDLAQRKDAAFRLVCNAVGDILYTLAVAELGRDEQGLAELVDEWVEEELSRNWRDWIRPLEELSFPIPADLFTLQTRRVLTPLAARKLPELLGKFRGQG